MICHNTDMKSRQSGFTLPELLVIGGIIIVFLIVGALIISSKVDVDAHRRDSQRRIDIAAMATSLKKYVADNHAIPDGISAEEQFIGNADGEYDLCAVLVPDYAQDLPFDPMNAIMSDAQTCPFDDSDYATGYSVQQKDKTLIIAAPFGETDQDIKFEINY